MSCNCGCHDDKVPATGWRRFVPLIAGAVVIGAIMAAGLFKGDRKDKPAARTSAQQAANPPTP